MTRLPITVSYKVILLLFLVLSVSLVLWTYSPEREVSFHYICIGGFSYSVVRLICCVAEA